MFWGNKKGPLTTIREQETVCNQGLKCCKLYTNGEETLCSGSSQRGSGALVFVRFLKRLKETFAFSVSVAVLEGQSQRIQMVRNCHRFVEEEVGLEFEDALMRQSLAPLEK